METREKRFQKRFEELAPQFQAWGLNVTLATITPEAKERMVSHIKASFDRVVESLENATTEPLPINAEYGLLFGHEQRNDDTSSIDLKLYLQFAPQDIEHLEVFEVKK